MPNTYKCSTNNNCQSGLCNGTVTSECRGTCKKQGFSYVRKAISSFFQKYSKPIVNFIDECGADITKSVASCLNPETPCKINLGGNGSRCLTLRETDLPYSYSKGPLTISGKIRPASGLRIEADITNKRFSVEVFGKFGVTADISINTSVSDTFALTAKTLYLSNCNGLSCVPCKTPAIRNNCRPIVIYQKVFMAGFVPVILEVKAQIVAKFELKLKAGASFTAQMHYNNDAVIAIKAIATFDGKYGANLKNTYKNNFHTNIKRTLKVEGNAEVFGQFQIGTEITVAINGFAVNIYPALHFVVEGKVLISSKACLSGLVSAGVGLTAGISTGFSVPDAGVLIGAAINALKSKFELIEKVGFI